MAGQLKQRGDQTWLIRIFLGSTKVEGERKRHYYNETFHGSRKDADRRRRELLTQADQGLLLPGGEVDTVDGYAKAWLLGHRVAERTLADYHGTLKRYILPHLGFVKIRELNATHIKSMLHELLDRNLSARTVRMAHEVLRNMLESAVEENVIPFNPARGRAVSKALPKRRKKERTTLQPDDVPTFLEAAEEDRLSALWHVLLLGGLRPEEALALRWSDLSDDTVVVRRVLADKSKDWPKYKLPKSDRSHRPVVLPEAAVKELRAWRRAQLSEHMAAVEWNDSPEDGELIFTDQNGNPLRQHQLFYPFKALLERAALPDMRLYDLRHSHATLLLAAGAPLEAVKQRLGHSTIVLTSDTYGGWSEDAQKRAAEAMQKLTGS